jgi:hypothetical protein
MLKKNVWRAINVFIIIMIIILFFQLELSKLAPIKICIALSKYIVTLQSGEVDMTKCKYIIIF